MERQEAIEFLLDHYEHPHNKGSLTDASFTLTGGNPGCADLITIQVQVDESGKVADIHFEGEGCTISMAAASYVTDIAQGLTLDEIESMSFEDLIEDLGREVVMTRPSCATLALGTLKKGAHEYHMKIKANA